jgi:hypothetical protein
MSAEVRTYLSPDEYRQAAETVSAVIGMVALSFAKHECGIKDIIIRNFAARSAIALKGVFALWDLEDYQDAWAIHRGILDRLFHLHHIATNDQFAAFEAWSFFEQYKGQNRVKSDNDFKDQATGSVYELSEAQRQRIRDLANSKPTWKRPRAEHVAKQMGVSFLYKYGYDYASMHVHPMASDGEQDFYTITGFAPDRALPSQITVLSNSVLAVVLVLQDALNFSSFRWRRLLWTYCEQMLSLLRSGDTAYRQTFLSLAEQFKSGELCEPVSS